MWVLARFAVLLERTYTILQELVTVEGDQALGRGRDDDFPLPPPFPFRLDAEADRGLSVASKSCLLRNLLWENGHSEPFEHHLPAPYRAAEWK